MIKLERTARPSKLTQTEKVNLTKEYLKDSTSVWNAKYIKDALLDFSYNKCSYCETIITEESKYLEVDHFFCKSKYEYMVIEWYNLLPSCKRCNRAKWDHDVLIDGMLIDPTLDNPSDHIFMINYRIYGKTKVGETTETELNLNDPNRLTLPRLRIGNETANALRRVRDDLSRLIHNMSDKKLLKKVSRGVFNVLSQALPNSSFSATAATVIDTSPDYQWIVQELKVLGLWTTELDQANGLMRQASLAA